MDVNMYSASFFLALLLVASAFRLYKLRLHLLLLQLNRLLLHVPSSLIVRFNVCLQFPMPMCLASELKLRPKHVQIWRLAKAREIAQLKAAAQEADQKRLEAEQKAAAAEKAKAAAEAQVQASAAAASAAPSATPYGAQFKGDFELPVPKQRLQPIFDQVCMQFWLLR